MTANRTVSLICSECLKCKGSHLLVRCPRQTASTEKKKNQKEECYHTHLGSYFPIKWKNHIFCSSVLPLWICQHDVKNTIDNSPRFHIVYETICYRDRRTRHPSFRIKILTSARKSTPHPGRASTSFASNQVVGTKLPVCDQCNARCYRDLAPAPMICMTVPH